MAGSRGLGCPRYTRLYVCCCYAGFLALRTFPPEINEQSTSSCQSFSRQNFCSCPKDRGIKGKCFINSVLRYLNKTKRSWSQFTPMQPSNSLQINTKIHRASCSIALCFSKICSRTNQILFYGSKLNSKFSWMKNKLHVCDMFLAIKCNKNQTWG